MHQFTNTGVRLGEPQYENRMISRRAFISTAFSCTVGLHGCKRSSECGPVPVRVDVQTQTWLDNYLLWLHIHSPGPRNPDAPPVMLAMPYLEVFNQNGVSIYHGRGASPNAAYLTNIDEHLKDAGRSNPSSPTLQDYFAMLAGLHSRVDLLESPLPKVLSITFRDKPFCEAQNVAVDQLKGRPRLQVIEIVLHG